MRLELSLACGQEDDFELALLALGERGTGDLNLVLVRTRVGDFDWSTVADLKTIVVGRS